MTNIFGSDAKIAMKRRLFEIGVAALSEAGWNVERVIGNGKSSVRRITRGSESKIVSIRTTQDTWIAFPRTEGDKSWRTLDEVDAVVPVSVDNKEAPKFAKVHLIDGQEMRARFNRAYEARKRAGHVIPVGRGVWISLYAAETDDPVSLIGAGAGVVFPPFATVRLSLDKEVTSKQEQNKPMARSELGGLASSPAKEEPLTIAEAKRRLAATLGVDPASIKISVEA